MNGEITAIDAEHSRGIISPYYSEDDLRNDSIYPEELGDMFVEINPESSRVRAHRGRSQIIPATVQHGTWRRYYIRGSYTMSPKLIYEMLDKIKPLSRRVKDGLSKKLEDGIMKGFVNEDARDAEREIIATMQEYVDRGVYESVSASWDDCGDEDWDDWDDYSDDEKKILVALFGSCNSPILKSTQLVQFENRE